MVKGIPAFDEIYCSFLPDCCLGNCTRRRRHLWARPSTAVPFSDGASISCCEPVDDISIALGLGPRLGPPTQVFCCSWANLSAGSVLQNEWCLLHGAQRLGSHR